MKQLFWIGIIFLLNVHWAIAQKKIRKGIVKYVIHDIYTETPEVELMKGSTLTLYFTDEQQKIELNLMDGALRTQTIMNIKTGKSIMLADVMGQKIKVIQDNEEFIPKGAALHAMYDKNTTKKIEGYKCHKVILKGDNGEKITAFITNKIKPKADYFNTLFMNMEGFPLEYSISNEEVIINFIATEVSHKIDDTVFYILGDYIELTVEEFDQFMGGMKLGF